MFTSHNMCSSVFVEDYLLHCTVINVTVKKKLHVRYSPKKFEVHGYLNESSCGHLPIYAIDASRSLP